MVESYKEVYEIMSNPDQFIIYWVANDKHKPKFVPPSTWTIGAEDDRTNNHLMVSFSEIVERCEVDYEYAFRKFKHHLKTEGIKLSEPLLPVPRGALKVSLQAYMRNRTRQKQLELWKSIAYVGENDKVDEFLRLIKPAGYTELDQVAVKHWFWNLKRKIFDKSHRFEQMLVFTGPQGCGKTKLLESLTSGVLKDYSIFKSMEDIMQPRSHIVFSRYYVACFDELAGANRTCVTTLKDLITKDTFSPMQFYTQESQSFKMQAMMIGTSNKSVNNIILDTTGMRRFYEITIEKKLNIEALLKFDWTALMQGIDENLEEGFIHSVHEDLMLARSDEQAFEDDFDMFVNEYGIAPAVDEGEVIEVDSKRLFALYYEFARKANFMYVKNASMFGRYISSIGVKNKKITTKNRRKTRYYLLDKSKFVDLNDEITVTLGARATQ